MDADTRAHAAAAATTREKKLTFSPEVRFESLLLLEVLEYFDHAAALPYGVPTKTTDIIITRLATSGHMLLIMYGKFHFTENEAKTKRH